jgi:hypothetical protein
MFAMETRGGLLLHIDIALERLQAHAKVFGMLFMLLQQIRFVEACVGWIQLRAGGIARVSGFHISVL